MIAILNCKLIVEWASFKCLVNQLTYPRLEKYTFNAHTVLFQLPCQTFSLHELFSFGSLIAMLPISSGNMAHLFALISINKP